MERGTSKRIAVVLSTGGAAVIDAARRDTWPGLATQRSAALSAKMSANQRTTDLEGSPVPKTGRKRDTPPQKESNRGTTTTFPTLTPPSTSSSGDTNTPPTQEENTPEDAEMVPVDKQATKGISIPRDNGNRREKKLAEEGAQGEAMLIEL